MTWSTPYRLERGADSLRALGGRLPAGLILERQPGLYILACPACAAMQFTANTLSGTDAAPTLAQPITCGAGRCKQCGITFRIVSGRAEPCERIAASSRPIPAALQRAGVRPPPARP